MFTDNIVSITCNSVCWYGPYHYLCCRRLGTWPVAILTGAKKEVSIEGPVCNGSQVIGWHRNKGRTTRSFHTAMAGFAFNSTVLWEPNRWLRLNPAPKRKHDSIEEDSEVILHLLSTKIPLEFCSDIVYKKGDKTIAHLSFRRLRFLKNYLKMKLKCKV